MAGKVAVITDSMGCLTKELVAHAYSLYEAYISYPGEYISQLTAFFDDALR